ncbi:ACP S-malonyltransferase [Exilibacterium tricleocarpae]|uniref:Malonyl CoA-acyl carrier protein transacylase n=1 Tax=Exilibacterium tricleocarpae TaxID=2591008 RepID=A0A545T8H2_9GAMM|nr:ACP S-malonyltransferase [Exilibacterium tricleocarpae]TQV73485.1 ACP S-malonyltransferase [Exilibacterium tricleocarpae]
MTSKNLAFVFPGQGSQKIGMLADMAAAYPLVRETFAEAGEVLGYDLWDLVQTGTEQDISLTERTQPLLLSASVALWRVWQQRGGPAPRLLAGHSLGEWSALVCAGVVGFVDAVRLVQQRGKFMQAAVAPGVGAMAAIIGLNDDAIEAVCSEAAGSDVVAAVNFNSPGQVVIAGNKAAVDRAIALCKEAGAKRAMPLPVSAPFHTELMRPAAEQLAQQIAQTVFTAPAIPVVHNVHARTEADAESIKKLMIEQIYSPVRWVDCVNALAAAGIETAVECGPGKVLAGLNKRIQRAIVTGAVDTPAELDKTLEVLSTAG